MNILGAVITYYPREELLLKNLSAWREEVGHIFIWENTPAPDNMQYRHITGAGISYHGTGKNVFIAQALNAAVKYAADNGFTHLLTLDQDSQFSPGALAKLAEAMNTHPEFRIGVPFVLPAQTPPPAQPIQAVPAAITSGSLFDLRLFEEIGGFDEDYKIDSVDFEFCLRARKHGFGVYQIRDAVLNQQFGRTSRHFCCHTNNYPPMRLYFQTRNRRWLKRGYPRHGLPGMGLFTEIKLAAKILLFEKQKLAKFRAIRHGIIDGRRPKGAPKYESRYL